MKNKNILVLGGVAVLIVIFAVVFTKNSSDLATTNENGDATSTSNTTSGKVATGSKKAGSTTTTPKVTTPILKNLEFIDKRMMFTLKDYPDVKFTIEKVAFGRGETVVSTGCTGIPNKDFSTYLYPGSGICLGQSKVDGSPLGIVALHLLIENNGRISFGGNSDVLKLHYLRADSTGQVVNRFAHPLNGLASYYINQYESRQIILSYLVPEDQLVYNFIGGYKEPTIETKGSLNIFSYATNGLLIDFKSDSLTLVK